MKAYDPTASDKFDFNYLIGGDGAIYEYNALGKTNENSGLTRSCADKYITLAIFGNFKEADTVLEPEAWSKKFYF